MKAVIDTNVLIYDTFEDSVYHIKAKNILDSLDEWIIPTIVIHEYVWVMKSLVNVEDVVYKVEEYVNHYKTSLVPEKGEDILEALKRIRKENISLSRYNDEVILSIAMRVGVLATFDNKLRKRSESVGIKLLPRV